MTMAPQEAQETDRSALFADCRALADRLGLADCSMGMSGDWPLAVQQGGTWLRIGSALFGPRSTSQVGAE